MNIRRDKPICFSTRTHVDDDNITPAFLVYSLFFFTWFRRRRMCFQGVCRKKMDRLSRLTLIILFACLPMHPSNPSIDSSSLLAHSLVLTSLCVCVVAPCNQNHLATVQPSKYNGLSDHYPFFLCSLLPDSLSSIFSILSTHLSTSPITNHNRSRFCVRPCSVEDAPSPPPSLTPPTWRPGLEGEAWWWWWAAAGFLLTARLMRSRSLAGDCCF